MDVGHFYFLTDKYFLDCSDGRLMPNKAPTHKRPYFCAWKDVRTGLYWLVPISSQVDKYKEIYRQKVKNNKVCITLMFGNVLAKENVFLLQNMCPATDKYVSNEYLDKNNHLSVRIDGAMRARVSKNARKILALQRQGKHMLFADVLEIEKFLLGKRCKNECRED